MACRDIHLFLDSLLKKPRIVQLAINISWRSVNIMTLCSVLMSLLLL